MTAILAAMRAGEAGRRPAWLRWVVREPLLLFAIIGAVLFTADHLISSPASASENPQLITVDREALLRFLQYRSKVFSEEGAGRSLDAMPAEQKEELIDSFVREEALYREAVSWGLDQQDYVIRRRLVQSLEFALAGEGEAAEHVADEATLRRFYRENTHLYALSPTVSFRHAFFRAGPEAAGRARSALAEIEAERTDPATLGDRFLYGPSFAGESLETVGRDFGKAFADALAASREKQGWIGPIRSDHGLHLVEIVRSDAGGLPPFEAVRDKVAVDHAEAVRRESQEKAVEGIVGQYRIAVAPGLR